MLRSRKLLFLCGLFVLAPVVLTDTPANCTYEDIAGKWIFYEGPRIYDNSINCSEFANPTREVFVDLRYPDVAIDEFGNEGHWTIVYNQALQVIVNQRIFFAYSYYDVISSSQEDDIRAVRSYCDRTFPSWSHDVTLRHWACFYGRKVIPVPRKVHQNPFYNMTQGNETVTLEILQSAVDNINNMQTSWTARVYPQFIDKTHEEMVKISGGKRSWLPHKVSAANASALLKSKVAGLPTAFDWRNVDGVNYVSPVRNQGSCGSCYAFSSMGMLSSRLRVMTNNRLETILAPQDPVTCSVLTQGCDGGFVYLTAGKYAKEFGVVEEDCAPYEGGGSHCTANETCTKHYTASYGYVGGYYGACNEELMMLELIQNGPLSISMEVEDDFHHYSGGIYHHTGLGKFNPYEALNHAVLLVGYGVNTTTQEKFWIVQNSWGESWGEDGYFRIRRGTDECGIESCAVYATPIPY